MVDGYIHVRRCGGGGDPGWVHMMYLEWLWLVQVCGAFKCME
jgi:hypothetical protein